MGIGKKLMIIGFYTTIASVLLVVCISALGIVSLASSGKPVCFPGRSIRCYDKNCGRFFQRCGSNALLEVPADQVCYGGALLPAKRTDLYSCPSASIESNSSSSQNQSVGSCPCLSCNWPCCCACLCSTSASAKDVANCYNTGICTAHSPVPRQQIEFAAVQRLFPELFSGQWLQDLAASFTFREVKMSAIPVGKVTCTSGQCPCASILKQSCLGSLQAITGSMAR